MKIYNIKHNEIRFFERLICFLQSREGLLSDYDMANLAWDFKKSTSYTLLNRLKKIGVIKAKKSKRDKRLRYIKILDHIQFEQFFFKKGEQFNFRTNLSKCIA